MSKSTKKFAVGVVIAAGLGYVVGLLTAPKSGKETRNDIKTAAVKTKRQLELKLKKLHSETIDLIKAADEKLVNLKGKAKTDAKKIIEKARNATIKAKEVMSAFHEGEADDIDLDKAIKDLQSSVSGLKNFIKK
ncbi:YtxH domain-containing protein [Candidatus Saccharibacteria bacterium]|nr:YtxH domain-containing protein [Candidatus Saccharibacteria bacterium]